MHVPPSEKLNIAGVGIGGKGYSDLTSVESENIVALCDVDWAHAGRAFKRYPKARKWKDYRKMLDEQKDIDAVVTATPDHMHAPVSMAAIRHGKHIYCQKPLTHTVREARALAEAARKAKVASQMGNQGHTFEGMRRIKEWSEKIKDEIQQLPNISQVETFGARDYQPTPHGQLIQRIVAGQMPAWWAGGLSLVGITDAAEAFAGLDRIRELAKFSPVFNTITRGAQVAVDVKLK